MMKRSRSPIRDGESEELAWLDLLRLHAAEQDLANAPEVSVVVPCEQTVTNDVTANVAVAHVPGWFDDAGQGTRPAIVMLSIIETHPDLPYQGSGTVSVTGDADLFCDSNCTTPAAEAFTAEALRATLPLFVRGNSAGNVTVTLTITPDANPNVRVIVPSATEVVGIQAINVVNPTVTVGEAIAWHHEEQFAAAQITLGLAESTGQPPYAGRGRPTVVGGSLFTDANCETPVDAFDAGALRHGVTVYVKGANVGNASVQLALDAVDSPGIRVAPPQTGDIPVQAINVVSPTVTVGEAIAWHHEEQFAAAQITLGLAESTGQPPYAGRGRPTVVGGSLFTDANCETPVDAFDADALRHGVTVYVKGANVGNASVQLALDAVDSPGIRVAPPQTGDIPVQAINVVSPTVTVGEAIAWHHEEQFAAAQITLGLAESTGQPPYAGRGRPTVVGGSLFTDANCETPVDAFDADALRHGVTVYVKGANVGNASVQLALDAVDSPGIRVAPPQTGDIPVQAINVVSPTVTVGEAIAWHHEEQFAAAQITLGLAESTGQPPYAGRGRPTVVGGSLFTDANCETPVDAFDADALRHGVTVYVKGANVGNASVQLALDAVDSPGIRVAPPRTGDIPIQAINVVSPSIRCDELVLVHGNHHNRSTDPSRLILEIDQTDPTHTCGDLNLRLDYGAQIACFRDQLCTNAVASGTTFAANQLPVTLYMRGVTAGNCDVSAEARGTAGSAWRLAARASKTVCVEKIELQVPTFAGGLSLNPDPLLNAPKQRELHAKNNQAFTFAKMTVTAPSNAFWQKADQLSLEHANLEVFDDAAGALAGTALLNQAHFGGHPVVRYFATQGNNPAWDAIPTHGHGIPATRNPVKVVTARYVSCAARISAAASADGIPRTLNHGDVVCLDTFSFDQHLDRLTGNECRTRALAGPANTDVALALAAAHKYYGRRTAFWVNRNYRAIGGSPFGLFLNSMNNPHGNNNTWATAGANWIENFLLNDHGIVLNAQMKTRIRNHIFAVISGATVIPHGTNAAYGFAALYGVPGVHAECLATNQLLAAGVAATDVTVATYMLQEQHQRQGRPFVACPNCSGILVAPGQFRVITG